MAAAQPRTSSKSLFKESKNLPVPCQYILSLMNFIINNQESFQTNSPIHNINTQNKHHLRRPNVKLLCFKKCTFYAGIKIFNYLPCSLKILKTGKTKLKVALKKYLYEHSFYPVDEFFMCKCDL